MYESTLLDPGNFTHHLVSSYQNVDDKDIEFH